MNFLHPKSNIEGDVTLGENVSVWPFASLRGDNGQIIVGNNSNIQDCVVLHDRTTIGENVTVGHSAIVHGATIGNNVLIGMGSIIMTGAVIEDWCIIAAGSLIPENTHVPIGSLVMGVPGRVIRQVAENERERITSSWQKYVWLIKENV